MGLATETEAPESAVSSADALRVGLFSESFHPVQNGVTTSVLTLVAGLRARQHRVWVFAPAHQRQRGPEANVLRFPSFVSSFNREYPLAYPFLPRLALSAHFSRLRMDVVHTHTPFVLGLTGANLAISRGVPLIATFHTLYSQYSHYVPFLPDVAVQSFLEHYLPWYYNRCSEIICPSETASRSLQAQGVERPIEIIPTGIPLPAREALSQSARERARAQFDLPPDRPLLLFAGRLAPEKNVAWLLEVFARVRALCPTACLAIAGGGPCLEELQALTKTLLPAGAVCFLGPTPRRHMDALYAAADVFCFPSPSETQGLVIGEARAAGTPCVVVDAGGAPETVRDGEDGFRTPPDDAAAFAARVVQILHDPALRAHLHANALRNARQFTPQTMVERVMTVYERARLQSGPPRWNHPALPEDLNWAAVEQAVQENRGHTRRV